jgi:glutamate carboxypeptidase
MSELLTYFEGRRQEMIDLLTEMVNYETPTGSKEHVDQLVDFLEKQFNDLQPSSLTRIEQAEVGDFLLVKWNEDAPGQPILFLVHIDTVWPLGTLAERPVTIDDDGRLFGPGAFDMKGGVTIALSAISGLIERGELPERPIWFLVNSDEEIGSGTSTPLIEELGGQAGLVIVPEPATNSGAMKIWRKGIGIYDVRVKGRAAHAGNAPEQGINAVVELAQQILKINEMNDLRNGTSVSPNVIHGGTARNVIAPAASLQIDVRCLTMQAMDEIHEKLMNLHPFLPGAEVEVIRSNLRGPMEHNDLMKATFAQCQQIGERYGITVRGEGAGGGSDGNTTAILGTPTLDGIGAQGDGPHAVHEHVLINSLPQRATLIAGILQDWVVAE